MAGGSRRRNLRPRKRFEPEPEPEPVNRRARRSNRGSIEPKDFIVYDNEEDSDYGDFKEPVEDISESGDESELESEDFVKPKRPQRASRRVVNREITPRSRTRIVKPRRKARALEPPPRSRRARANIKLDVVMEDAAAQDDSSSYSSQEDVDEGPDSGLETDSDAELEFGKARSVAPKNTRKRRVRPPKVILAEDVPGRKPSEPQPANDPELVEYAPSVAFLAVFVATFYDLFSDFPKLPCPQDIEEGLITEEPSELVDLLFRRLLLLVLNRKKELETGRYASALSELHSLKGTLGQGPWFPPLNWKSRTNAFQELGWADRAELLHVLVHWSLTNSDRVRNVLKNLGEETTMPWMGADEQGSHYYIVGFDPVAENSLEYTRFRVYKETNRLLSTVSWSPVASNAEEVVQFLKDHLKEGKSNTETVAEPVAEPTTETVTEPATEPATETATEPTTEVKTETGEAEPAEPAEESEKPVETEEANPLPVPTDPNEYDLPATVVEILTNLLPVMFVSEEQRELRIAKEAKRVRRRHIWVPPPSHDEGRRRRRNRVDFFDLVRRSDGIYDEEENPRKRRRRDETWHEPEPETREQRHARLLADKMERIQSEEAALPELEPQDEHFEQPEQPVDPEPVQPQFVHPRPVDTQPVQPQFFQPQMVPQTFDLPPQQAQFGYQQPTFSQFQQSNPNPNPNQGSQNWSS